MDFMISMQFKNHTTQLIHVNVIVFENKTMSNIFLIPFNEINKEDKINKYRTCTNVQTTQPQQYL